MGSRHALVALMLALVASTLSAAGEAAPDFEAARGLLERGQFSAAREALEPLARAGHLEAQSAMAAMVQDIRSP